ncbi:MAG: FkbM family methyltransferase [ANME-2 cluster archaeon]|nr:FkbM family methyltransferase [ANME-2 cluster archaeon]
MNILNKNIYLNDFVPPIIHKMIRYVAKNRKIHPFDCVPKDINVHWILDVGANMGDVSIAAMQSYPSSKVICFEPVKQTYKLLEQNLMLYSNRVILFNQALSDENGLGEINLTTFNGANSILPQSKSHQFFNPRVKEIGKEAITLVKLDDIADKFPTNYIDIMKIDVEGYELNVLNGGREFIKDHVDTIIIEIALMRDQSWNEQAIVDIFITLKSLGFCLINIIDLHHSDDSSMMLVQMDCIFRKNEKCEVDSLSQKKKLS